MNGMTPNPKSGDTMNSEELLTEISGKLTLLISKFDTMFTNIHEVVNTIKIQGDSFNCRQEGKK